MKTKKLLSLALAILMIVSTLSAGMLVAGAADAPTVSASADKASYVVNAPIRITVTAPDTVQKISLYSETNTSLAVSRSSVNNGNGTITWTLAFSLATKGGRTLKVYTDGVDTGTTVKFKIVDAYTEPDQPAYIPPTFISASGPATATLNEPFPVTVVTGQGTTLVTLFSETGAGLASTKMYTDNEDGTRTWVLMTAVGSTGNRKFTVKYADGSKLWIDSGVTLSVKVAKAVTDPDPVPTPAKTRATVHDPAIVQDKDTGEYYVFGSNQGVAKSSDLSNWSRVTTNLYGADIAVTLAESFAWSGYRDGSTNAGNGTAIWAPDAIYNPNYVNKDGSKGAYMLFYPASSNYKRACIGYAVSQSIAGPYEYVDTIIYTGFTLQGGPDEPGVTLDTKWTRTNLPELIEKGVIEGLRDDWFIESGYNIVNYPQGIDPTVFFDADGKLWMLYGSHGGGIWLLELDKTTGQPIYPGRDGVTAGGNDIDRYFGIRVGSGYSKNAEGAYIAYDHTTGYYYMYITYGQITNGYNMREFRSKNVTGPYLDAKGQNAAITPDVVDNDPIGVKLMSNYKLTGSTSSYRHGGHNSVFIAADGQMYNTYHQRFTTGTSYQDRTHQMFRNEDGWPVMAVYENNNDKISQTGYAKSEVVGYYEFLNHGSQTSNLMLDTLLVRLNEDGTITGDIVGTWGMTNGTYYMNATINGVVYKGVFFKQQDESGVVSQVMTFSAIGENNESIWGSRLNVSDSNLKAVEKAAAAITVPSSTTENLSLLTAGIYDTKVLWFPSNTSVISSSGVITRDAVDTQTTLTAVIMKDGAIVTKNFLVTVKAKVTGSEQFTTKPQYLYEFTRVDGYLTNNTGSLVGIGTLTGNAAVVTDPQQGQVLSTSGGGVLALPRDTLKGISSGFSVSMWVKGGSSGALFKATKDTVVHTALSGNLSATVTLKGNTVSTNPVTLNEGEWYYITYTVDKNGIAVYKNGVLADSRQADLSAMFKGDILSDLTVTAGDGTVMIDNLAVYGIALSATQANALIDPNIAWQANWRIDFGTETSPINGGFVQMTHNNLYNKVNPLQNSYGFDRALTSHQTPTGGAYICDFVYAPGGVEYTFKIDLPNGTYRVMVYTGAKDAINTTNFMFQDNSTVYSQTTPEGVASDNYGGPNTYTVVVTDNVLKMTIWGDQTQGPDFITGRLNGLEITKQS